MAELTTGVPGDYAPSEGEIDNLVYMVCKYTVGWGMRACDLAAVKMTGPREVRGEEGLRALTRAACEYVWDHICGEPEEPTADDLYAHMAPMLSEWYANSTPEERASTE